MSINHHNIEQILKQADAIGKSAVQIRAVQSLHQHFTTDEDSQIISSIHDIEMELYEQMIGHNNELSITFNLTS